MKIIYIECDAEEMRANRTILDNLSEAFSCISRQICGTDISPEAIVRAAEALNQQEQEEV